MFGSIYNFSVTKIIEEFFKSKGNSPNLRSSKKLYGNDTQALDHISDLPKDHIDVDEARRKHKEQTSSSLASSTVFYPAMELNIMTFSRLKQHDRCQMIQANKSESP